jgi:hypothetical protein
LNPGDGHRRNFPPRASNGSILVARSAKTSWRE